MRTPWYKLKKGASGLLVEGEGDRKGMALVKRSNLRDATVGAKFGAGVLLASISQLDIFFNQMESLQVRFMRKGSLNEMKNGSRPGPSTAYFPSRPCHRPLPNTLGKNSLKHHSRL